MIAFEKRCKYYRRHVDNALHETFGWYGDTRHEYPQIDDDTVCMAALSSCLRRLADEADARIKITAQTRALLHRDDPPRTFPKN